MAVITEKRWDEARRVTRRALRTSFHCSISSIGRDGSPHVTPIGSLLLTGPGAGVYFEVFNTRLAANVDRDPRIEVLAVDTSPIMWLRSLLGGKFTSPPGLRLVGTAGPARPSTPAEVARFHRWLGPLIRTRGAASLFASLPVARDVHFTRVEGLNMGPMTPGAH